MIRAVVFGLVLAIAGPAAPAPAASPPALVLRDGTPQQAGMLPQYLDQAVAAARAGMAPQASGHPLYPGAVVLAARHGVIARTAAMGWALRYATSAPTELPADQWIPMRDDTIFDIASLSKLFTSIVAVQQVERGLIDLDAPVAHYIPAFAANGKAAVTVRQLLTHTSGLPPDLPLFSMPDNPTRFAAVYAVQPVSAPGTAYLYSDLNMIVLASIVEFVTGSTLDDVVRRGITEPLGLRDTGYNPPASARPRIAATEDQPGRGMVWGGVHDENAFALGGVAGHAGVFSTVRDLAVLAQTVLNGGAYGRVRILSAASTALLLTNFNGAFPGNDHGLGFELYQQWYMGAMGTPYSAGHTGFTGTTLVIDPTTQSFLVFLTNRVHPSRDWGSINPPRRAVADAVARAVPVRPDRGPTAWFSGMGNARTATLTLPVPAGAAAVRFSLWYDTEPRFDPVTLESSVDGGHTWTALPFSLGPSGVVSGFEGRQWLSASAALPAVGLVRWRYSTDGAYQGRGVYVDAIRVLSPAGKQLFSDDRPADAASLGLSGFSASAD
jgi:CubicO group peptidase (beta-lactamase class C family)